MTPERRKCAVREAQQRASIARQRLARHVSAATDKKLIPGHRFGTERVSASTNIQQTRFRVN
jgi:hypothetical protein